MKQRISHGATIDTATPEEVAKIVAGQFNANRSREYTRIKNTFALDASGNGVHTLHKVPAEWDWLCERITITTGAAALVTFFENAQNPSDMLEVIGLGSTGLYSDSFDNTLYIPANSQLVMVCAGGGANGQLAYNLQIRLLRRPQ